MKTKMEELYEELMELGIIASSKQNNKMSEEYNMAWEIRADVISEIRGMIRRILNE